jgi:hypothetical protein
MVARCPPPTLPWPSPPWISPEVHPPDRRQTAHAAPGAAVATTIDATGIYPQSRRGSVPCNTVNDETPQARYVANQRARVTAGCRCHADGMEKGASSAGPDAGYPGAAASPGTCTLGPDCHHRVAGCGPATHSAGRPPIPFGQVLMQAIVRTVATGPRCAPELASRQTMMHCRLPGGAAADPIGQRKERSGRRTRRCGARHYGQDPDPGYRSICSSARSLSRPEPAAR